MGADFHGEKITICGTRRNEVILTRDKFLRTRLSGQRFPDKDFRTSISGLKNKVDGRIMGLMLRRIYKAKSHLQSGRTNPIMHAI